MKLHSHAIARMIERGTSEKEIASTIRDGERFAVKFGRAGFSTEFRIWRAVARSPVPYEAGRGSRHLGGRRLAGDQRDCQILLSDCRRPEECSSAMTLVE